MEVSIEDWFRQLPHDEDTPKPEEERALRDFLCGCTSADVAAKQFTSVLANEEDPVEELPRLWGFILNAAQEQPSKQEKLVELLRAIQHLPDLERNGEVLVYARHYKIWKDLPKLDHLIRDEWEYSDTGPSNPERGVERWKWINLNAFAARLTSHGIVDLGNLGIWALREALEDEPWKNSSEPRIVDEREREDILHRRTIHVLDALVPAAAQWIFHASHVLLERNCNESVTEAPRQDQGNPNVGHRQSDSPEALNRKWAFWKARFGWVQQQAELQEQTRLVAREAAAAMEKR